MFLKKFEDFSESFALSVIVMAVILLTAALLAPLGNGLIGYPYGEQFYTYLSSICHQQPLRGFWLLNHPHALCARCMGGYSGVVLGGLQFFKFINSEPRQLSKVLLVSLAFFLLAVTEAALNVNDTNHWRLASGFIGGGGFAMWLLSTIKLVEISLIQVFKGVKTT